MLKEEKKSVAESVTQINIHQHISDKYWYISQKI